MTLSEARSVLGLGPDEDPRPHLREFHIVREKLAELVRTATDEATALRYQQGLQDLDRALAAIRESLETLAPAAAPAVPVTPLPGATSLPVPVAPAAERKVLPAGHTRRSRGARWLFALSAFFLLIAAAAGYYYWSLAETAKLERLARATALERDAAEHVLNRRWPEATAAYEEIARLLPGTETARVGLRSIEAGMAEETQQFAAYWNGQARAAIEAGRWDDAEAAVRNLLAKFPPSAETSALRSEIATARASASRHDAIARAEKQLEARDWAAARRTANGILDLHPEDPDASAILAEANAAIAKETADRERARALYGKALTRDQGAFDAEALEWLREAATLAPDDPEIAALFAKMTSYTRTLRVPEEFATPSEALAEARDRDRVVLSAGTWKGPIVVNAAIELQGAGPDKTRITCAADAGCAITLGPGASGARLTGLGFRHESLDGENERFSAALVRGAAVDLLDCHFIDACGHGLAVIEGGKVTARRCRFAGNGWNGAAVTGQGSSLEVADSDAIGNFENGIESWDGAALTARSNRCEGNTRNGIHADNPGAPVVVEKNQLRRNREFGLVLSAANGGHASDNIISQNLLGGAVIRLAAAIPVERNQLRDNQGPGLTLESGLDPASYLNNKSSGNTGKATLSGFHFEAPPAPPAPAASETPPRETPPAETPAAATGPPPLPVTETPAASAPEDTPPPRAEPVEE